MSASLSQSIPVPRAAALDVSRSHTAPAIANQLAQIRQTTGLSHTALVTSFVKLSRGPGKIAFPDFVRLRLFDPQFHGASPLPEFVGQRRNRDICVTVNYRHDWYGLLSDKVAVSGYLGSYGLPAIPIRAIYAPEIAAGSGNVLPDRQALGRFLSTPGNFPLFGKPVEGFQSLGSIGMRAFRSAEREIETTDGHRIALDQLLDEVDSNYRSGYVFQPLVRPDPQVDRLCGNRLATLRIVTALTEAGPRLLRACWKIPAGANMADNYWRDGNLLAQIDLDSGRVLRVSSGAGLDVRFHERHPDSGESLTGFAIPQWQEMRQLALRGAALMRHVPLIGWDIAPAEHGPVIVEMNETPDLFLVQFADRKGILDNEFRAFMDFQARNAAAHMKEMKAAIAKL